MKIIKGFENYLISCGYRMTSRNGYITQAERFMEWVAKENLTLSKVAYNDLLSFIQHNSGKGNTTRTINQKLTILKKFFCFLMEQGKRQDNPALELRIRNEIRRLPHDLLEMEELEKLYEEYPLSGITGRRNKVIVGLMIWQGLHAGELAALEMGDVNLEEGKIYISSVSRSNSRTLKLKAQQILHLQKYLTVVRPELIKIRRKESRKLFISSGSGDRLNNSKTRIMAVLKKLNPKIKDAHQIRSSVITHMMKETNIRQVQYLIGHKYVSSTEYYRIDKLEDLQSQLENLHR